MTQEQAIEIWDSYSHAVRIQDGCHVIPGLVGRPTVSYKENGKWKGKVLCRIALLAKGIVSLDQYNDARLYTLHKCNNKRCLNSDHLYLGTASNNSGDILSSGNNYNTNKTQCSQGHEYNATNTYITTTGVRQCRVCHKEREAIRRAKQV